MEKLLTEHNLIIEVEKLKKIIKDKVEQRFLEFKKLGEEGDELDLYSELCFCILTANWKAKGGIKAQKLITKVGFAEYPEEQLVSLLKKIGHRFPNTRAKYIIENRWIIGDLKSLIQQHYVNARTFLVDKIKGIGWKESSHFLRNTGVEDVAILDKHILKIMKTYQLIEDFPKPGWNKSSYLKLEKILKDFAEKVKEPVGKLDLYLWYLETNSIDK
ncbi:MAG: N-glycosylase/DNA lyase [Defluviitoga tunisiensis]|jgi:N-glycosylase/DNA lyase|uniref:8-oxoguanine DNA glycosylase/AP lyase n=1 Tax=Defluviitoga tunisiensis TaxID=1006576 RepID=A0A0C7P0U9_DEFTU|nr:N-glycosylase/DNA lyase [Defluviitoga tunisiensis]MDD3601449.1 N-glycosylase/DNA lyase [Defluviitoga tunisiensis]MDY0379163.1 N-glycosylase/DNA lyase [Defluviitoga tunisiensis]CEP77865.1 DNA lyase [Defluviitoga tunisiensis]HOB54802.1 N-glycosylase/DNA lyase [Defluviitoga tunisiensis]HOK16256.1 N-glycosylase/DNA lyase [Defluviitoga tunisiensis]